MLFANLHTTAGGSLRQTGKVVAVPVPVDRRNNAMAGLTDKVGEGSSLARIVRGNNFNRPVYRGELRVGLVKEAHTYLRATNPNFSEHDVTEYDQLELGNNHPEPEAAEVHNRQEEEEEDDPVERNRNTLETLKSVLLPDRAFAPASESIPTNFLRLRNPYAKTMPIFFPHNKGDIDDPKIKEGKVKEREWVLHMLRNVRKRISEFPIFAFTAAYRLDTQKLVGAYNALIGFRKTTTGEMVQSRDDQDRFTNDQFNLTGSTDYYKKQEMDIEAKCRTMGYPEIFYTFTNTDRWDITLATALSQEGYDVWHPLDERRNLTLQAGRNVHENEDVYHAHIREDGYAGYECPYHLDGCKRVPIDWVLDREQTRKLLGRNSYNVQRIFETRVRAVISNILMSANSNQRLVAVHSLKEFGDINGWVHTHGVGWLAQSDEDSIRPLGKMHRGEFIFESEKEKVTGLAERIMTTQLSATLLSQVFTDLEGSRAEDIVKLAADHQVHGCTKKCNTNNPTDGCYYHFPRFPSDRTLLVCPPDPAIANTEEAEYFTQSCRGIKMAVRETLAKLKKEGLLGSTSLLAVLSQAIGGVGLTPEGHCVCSKAGLFPDSRELSEWRRRLESEGSTDILLLAVYYTTLSAATWKVDGELVYQLVMKRNVKEAYVNDYNPYCLEAMRSNLAFELITHTPDKVTAYITKAKHKMGGKTKVENQLKRNATTVSGQKIADRAREQREVSLPEAYFRIDGSLKLAESNMEVLYVCTKFPEDRSSSYMKAEEDGIRIPGRDGLFKETQGLITGYSNRLR